MKNIILVIFTFIPILSFGQYRYGYLQEVYFGRHPSARAEAMGKAFNSIDGDPGAIFYNPAGTATIQGVDLNTSLASPFYSLNDAKYSFISATVKAHKYLTVGLSMNHFTGGSGILFPNGNPGTLLNGARVRTTIYTLNVSSQPIENLSIGLNANYLNTLLSPSQSEELYFDIGGIKKFKVSENNNFNQEVNIGFSLTNLNSAKLENSQEHLPVIAGFGINYQFELMKYWVSDSLNTFEFLIQGDYRDVLNSGYNDGIYSGVELIFLEILAARIGYYEEKQDDYGNSDYNKGELSDLTYGFGVQIPFNKLTKLPLKFNFDYTSLPQASYTKENDNWSNFSSYSIRLNYFIN